MVKAQYQRLRHDFRDLEIRDCVGPFCASCSQKISNLMKRVEVSIISSRRLTRRRKQDRRFDAAGNDEVESQAMRRSREAVPSRSARSSSSDSSKCFFHTMSKAVYTSKGFLPFFGSQSFFYNSKGLLSSAPGISVLNSK